MNKATLIARYRSLTDDISPKVSGTDEQITEWLNEGQRQAAFRKRLLIDGTVRVSVRAAVASYALDRTGIWIRRAKLALQAVPLAPVDYRDLDRSRHGWETQTGTPERYVRGLEEIGQPLVFRPYPIPVLNDTATLVVVREPLDDLAGADDEPEIDLRWHEDLVHWALFRGFSRPDADFLDADKALKYYERFEAVFGASEAAIIAEAQLEQERANRMVYADGTF